MRWHKIKVQAGGLFHEQRDPATIPYTSAQKGRMFYDDSTSADQLVYGNDDFGDYSKLFDDTHDLLPIAPSVYKIGDVGSEFLEVHSDDFIGNLAGDVLGNLKGDVLASNDEVVLNNGTSIVAQDSFFYGTIKSTNGSDCLDPGGTPGAAVFKGTSDFAKYA